MQRLSILGGLLLACAASLVSSASILEDGAPPLWIHTSDNPNDLQVVDGEVISDPWHYLQRMSLLRLLMGATAPHMGSMGTKPEDSPIWGPILELAWMITSGRLMDPTGSSTCGNKETGDPTCISPRSMWACLNYFVSAVPFLSAAENGFFGEGVKVRLKVKTGGEDFCYTHEECTQRFRNVTLKWDRFFQALKTQSDGVPEAVRKDTLLGLLWDAQMAAKISSPICEARAQNYAPTELFFAKGWVSAAAYVAATHFQSSFNNSASFIVRLPSRVLRESDSSGDIADFSDEEKHTLSVFSWMLEADNMADGSLVNIWAKSMCTMEIREQGRNMVTSLMLEPLFPTASFITFVGMTALFC